MQQIGNKYCICDIVSREMYKIKLVQIELRINSEGLNS
jgi:hypothetical protein